MFLLAPLVLAEPDPAWRTRAYDLPSVSADGATVHVVGDDGRLRALDTATGTARWTALAPEGQRFTREEAVPDGVVVLTGSDKGAHGICGLDGSGVRRWCRSLDRAPTDLVVTGAGVAVRDGYASTLVLDPVTGVPLGGWRSGGELHIYWDLGQPHDTEFYPAVALLGAFGAVTVLVDENEHAVVAMRRDGTTAWTRPLPAATRMGGVRGGLGFAHRVAPDVGSAAGLFLVGTTLLAIDGQGALAGARDVPEGSRLAGPRLITPDAVVGLDPASGAERWRTPVTGFVAAGSGWIGRRAPDDPRQQVVRLDPDTGAIVARIPLGSHNGPLTMTPWGVLVGPGADGRWACLDERGDERWAFPGTYNADVFGGVAARYPEEGPTELVDLATGQVLARQKGLVLAVTADVAVVTSEGDVVGVRLR